MPAIGAILPVIRRSGSTDKIEPPLGWVGSKAGKKGDLVTIDANGRVDQIVTPSGTGIVITSSTGRIGMLDRAIDSSLTNNPPTPCGVEKLDEDTTIELQAADGTTLSAIVGVATAANMRNKQYQLVRDLNGNYLINTAASGTPVVEVVDISPRYPLGEVGGTLICRVLPSSRLA